MSFIKEQRSGCVEVSSVHRGLHGQGANLAPRFTRPSAVGPTSHLRVLRVWNNWKLLASCYSATTNHVRGPEEAPGAVRELPEPAGRYGQAKICWKRPLIVIQSLEQP